MTVSMYRLSVPVFIRGLNMLSTLLEKAEAHAAENGIEPGIMLNSRLAPDMLSLCGQVQRASDTSKNALGRLTPKPAPSLPDTEATFAELGARIEKTVAYLETISERDLQGSETRAVNLAVGSLDVTFTGIDYLLEFAVPNFFFHVTTAYDILRHDGVAIGKRDYLGPFS